MPTTTDQPVTIREDRPTERTEPQHADRLVHSPPPTKHLRTNLGWIVVGIVAGIVAICAAVLVVVHIDADSTDTSVNHAVVIERGETNDFDSPITDPRANPNSGIAPVDNRRTQLDIRGIPTWWSHEPAASE